MTRIAIALLGLALLAACAPAPGAGPGSTSGAEPAKVTGPRKITAVIRSDPRTVSNKINATGGASQTGIDAIEQLIHAGLVNYDTQDRLLPQLAETVPTVENGLWKLFPDGQMEITWKLREGARWHDGALFTADDLVFTATVERDRDLTLLTRPEYAAVDTAEAPDSRTIVVRWKRPYIDATTLFTYALGVPLPRHLLERPLTEEKPTYLDHPYWTEGFVGLGPYRLGEWVRGSHLVVNANDQYVLGRPKIDEIDIRFIPDLQTVAANLLSGAVEVTIGRSTFSFEQGANVRDQWRDGTMLIKMQGWVAAYPQFVNPNPAVIRDARFRRALMHALDREQLADSLQLGLVPVAHSIVGPNEPVHKEIEPSIVKYEHDPRKAMDLVEAIGYTRGGDGFFRDAANQRLAVELRTTAELDIHLTTVFPMADAWQRVGVATEPIVIPPQRQPEREYVNTFPGFHMIGSGNSLTTAGLGRFHSSKAALAENNYQSVGNYPRYMNPEFDALQDRYFSTVPERERAQVLAQLINHMTDQVVVLGLFYNGSAVMVSNRIQGVTVGAQRASQTWNAPEWDVK
jgi:peptide/nickel transport system substrate-binding protein